MPFTRMIIRQKESNREQFFGANDCYRPRSLLLCHELNKLHAVKHTIDLFQAVYTCSCNQQYNIDVESAL